MNMICPKEVMLLSCNGVEPTPYIGALVPQRISEGRDCTVQRAKLHICTPDEQRLSASAVVCDGMTWIICSYLSDCDACGVWHHVYRLKRYMPNGCEVCFCVYDCTETPGCDSLVLGEHVDDIEGSLVLQSADRTSQDDAEYTKCMYRFTSNELWQCAENQRVLKPKGSADLAYIVRQTRGLGKCPYAVVEECQWSYLFDGEIPECVEATPDPEPEP